ncbi:MAG: hypothetical protein EOO15_20255 [Chitinophagaceae bacterium]|nr:MAG: hypothetical protein EOO15_20255 [Chitinophagaceae bacterium]
MRPCLALLLLFFGLNGFSQKIAYNLPEGLEGRISAAEYKPIVDSAVYHIASRWKVLRVDSGVVQLEENPEASQWNLYNLVSQCLSIPKEQRGAFVREYFQRTFRSMDTRKTLDLGSFAAARQYLALRIYPAQTVEGTALKENSLTRRDLEGTYTVVMLDLPDVFTNLRRNDFEKWKTSEEAVFAAATENVARQQMQKVSEEFDVDSSKIRISFLEEENYAASYVLNLERNQPDLVGAWGTVVAIPNKGFALMCRVDPYRPVDFVKFIQATYGQMMKSYQEHPQPVSDRYFWYYKGKFTPITVTMSGASGLQVLAPMGLSELMTKKK